MTEPYRPIGCDLHSEYELAILRRVRLRLRWRDAEGAAHDAIVRAVDMETTADKEEYLLIEREHGATERIRLDRILAFDPLT